MQAILKTMRPIAIVLVLLTGCTIKLAPVYDSSIVDGLNNAAIKSLEMLAGAAGGVQSATYPSRQDKYNSLIGEIDALALKIGSRPMPNNTVLDKVNDALAKRGVPAATGTAPSETALKNIYDALVKMRDTDKMQGLTVTEVKAFRGLVVIYFDQALTYETYLKR